MDVICRDLVSVACHSDSYYATSLNRWGIATDGTFLGGAAAWFSLREPKRGEGRAIQDRECCLDWQPCLAVYLKKLEPHAAAPVANFGQGTSGDFCSFLLTGNAVKAMISGGSSVAPWVQSAVR